MGEKGVAALISCFELRNHSNLKLSLDCRVELKSIVPFANRFHMVTRTVKLDVCGFCPYFGRRGVRIIINHVAYFQLTVTCVYQRAPACEE